jgi:hypothetical protein
MLRQFLEYYRCSHRYDRFAVEGPLSDASGYFRFGNETVYGRCSGRLPSETADRPLPSVDESVRFGDGTTYLPFDLDQVVDGLRRETYAEGLRSSFNDSLAANFYYLVRPILPVAIRKHLQRMRLHGWEKIRFPRWPVDRTVDSLMEHLLLASLRAQNVRQIPFIWFWPDGAPSCALMTHDVESASGVDLCGMLMDANESFGIKASFQVIPEERYHVTPAFLQSIRKRGFEVVVHDLNHDGRLFQDRKRFMERVEKINAYGKEFGAAGFRAGVLYRNQSWFDLLDFQYDMSVPNVAHLDPQRGGCCTVMPYFIGHLLELPVTMTQDYTLFNILNSYSMGLWQRQIELIMEKHGLISVVIHPDYITGQRERELYQELLALLAELKAKKNVWVTTPGEVDQWWRQRAQMEIVEENGASRIQGPGSERATIAYASECDGKLVYTWASSHQPVSSR